ncbi:hypothetical protein [Catenulispora subtropica]|uniref:hypothetical protein n=1 Tax=Catenulispora subtropica TaxID=450798 RepID=UPI003CD060F1
MDIAAEDAIEFAEMLEFLRDWLGGQDSELLAASLRRFVGTDGYDLAELRDGLACFTLLLDGSDGAELFDPEHR